MLLFKGKDVRNASVVTSLLTSKLYFPPVRSSLVARPRLVEQLQAGLCGSLTLISAPAGSGKTTLLSEWHAGPGSRMPTAWVSLDAADNDPFRFFQYLFAALDSLQEGVVREIGLLLQASSELKTEVILIQLVNALGNIPQDAALVLDDYHVIEAPAIHEVLTFLLDHLPPHMHLVLLTRSDPALPLARLRASGHLTEIRATDLRFSVSEAASFLNQVMGLDLTRDQVAALEKHTEGWIAGLQLAALSMQKRSDLDGFLSAFTGSHRYIVDYLVEEVLSRQTELVRNFLLQTSLLRRLNAGLCDAITGQSNSRQTLEQLERANLFVVPLDDEKCWFRYHHLFSDMLRQRLRNLHPELLHGLHTRAAEWYEQNGLFFEAMGHLMEAEEFERACNLLGENTLAIMREHRLPEFIRWMKAIPDAVLRRNPRVCLVYSYGQESLGDIDAYISYVQSAEKALKESLPPGTTEHAAILAEIKVNQANIAIRQGHLEDAITLTDEAIALAPADEHFVRSQAYMNAAWAKRELGQFVEAIPLCEQALSETRTAGHPGMTAASVSMLGSILKVLGRFQGSVQALLESLQIAQELKQEKLPVYSSVHYELARAYCELYDLDQAEKHIEQGLLLSEWGGRPIETLEGNVLQVWLQMLRRDGQGALRQIEKAFVKEQTTGIRQFHDDLTYYRAKTMAGEGKIREALDWLQESGKFLDEKIGYAQGIRALRRAHLLLDLNRLEEAFDLLDRLLAATEACHCAGWHIETMALLASAWQRKGDHKQALEYLKRAIILAEPEGYLRIFLGEGKPMLELLHLARSKGIAPEILHKIFTASQKKSVRELPGPRNSITPLSKREIELLRLIAAGRSNKEIASELVITLGTVKRHTVNIFTKLDVKNRTEAVARARELDLM